VDITLGTPRIFALDQRITLDEMRKRADEKKTGAVGSGIGGLLSRPKPEDVELVASQRRMEPFWHVACTAHYVYDRTRRYTVPVSAPDVKSVTVLGSDFTAVPTGAGPAAYAFDALEHCAEDIREALFVDGLNGTPFAKGPAYASGPRLEVQDPSELGVDGTLVLAPEQRASAIIRQLLAKVMRPLQADTVFEETLAVETLDLCYRPIWAFEYRLSSKGKQGVIEVDGVSGETHNAQALKVSDLTRRINRDIVFDLGADTAGLLIPGGSIAVKLAKVAIDHA
jgi:hypothetical protein